MILPADVNPLVSGGWVAVITYEASGYVSDEDAEKINYDDLLAQMQKEIAEESPKRVAKGFPSISLVGWAKKPYYDTKEKKIYWAKHLLFNNTQDTLNYEIRVLGRRGVLSLNIVGDMNMLPSIDQKIGPILSMTSFNPGNTYAEYDSKVDHAAAYGLAGLVAGGALVKTGLLKGLIALLVAGKKVVGVAVIGFFCGIWGRLNVVGKDELSKLRSSRRL